MNSTYITEKLSGTEDKIANTTWKISGYFNFFVTAKTYYTEEIINATKTHPAKIGIMYMSDYGFAASPDYWNTNLSVYDLAAKNNDWLYLGTTEWTLSPYSSDDTNAWIIYNGGTIYYNNTAATFAIRPSFYLTSDVQYASGTGALENPIRLKN